MLNKSKKNKGFTLVELLVAVAILAIVVGPLLYAFVISAETNTKARKVQAATLVAQNLEETVQALTVKNLAYEINYPSEKSLLMPKSNFDGSKELLLEEGEFIEAKREGEDKSSITASVYKNGESYEFLGQESGIYHFSVKGIKSQNFIFNALIKLDASAYRNGTAKENNQANPLNFNNRPLAQVANLNDLEDAFYVQKPSDNLDSKAAEEFERRNASYFNTHKDESKRKDVTYFELNITRTIKVDISHKGNLSIVKIIYEYSAPNGTVAPGQETIAYENTIYNNSESDAKLRGIYLFYIPLYKLPQGTSTTRDTIIINNQDNLKTNLYIIKQEYGLPIPTLQLWEEGYKADICLYENSEEQCLRIKTNLDTNLCALYDKNYRNDNLKQANYKYYIKDVLNSSKTIIVSGITEVSAGDMIYDLEISIYPSGTDKKDYLSKSKSLTIFTGSKYD